MFDLAQILELETMNQRTVYAAVRIAAYIAKNTKSVNEQDVKKALKINDLVWAAIRSDLSGKIFNFKYGRIDLIDDTNRPAPWDLVEVTGRKEQEAIEKVKSRGPAKPLGPTQQRFVDILGIKPANAYGFYNRFRTHSIEALNSALDAVEAKIKRDGPLDEPTGYFNACLKNASKASPAPARAVSRYPIIIKEIEPGGANLVTTQVGWEHSTQKDPNGNTIWPMGTRRKIYRLRSGQLHYELPKADEHVPTMDEDPGCVVKK